MAALVASLATVTLLYAGARTRRAYVSDTSVATIEGGNEIYLEVQAGSRDSYVSLAVRYSGTERSWAAIEQANGGRRVRPGLFYAIPFDLLEPSRRAEVLVALFAEDGPDESGWVHRVPPGDTGQRLERIAHWLTGDAGRAGILAELNGVTDGPLGAGAEIVVPSELLAAGLEEAAAARPLVAESPPTPPPEPAPEAAPPTPPLSHEPVTVGDLTYRDDESGGHAIYRLKKGESLYSAVVLRFTGRLHPDEVAAATREIARLSGIERVDAIPVGFPVKIPRALIRAEYLPPGDPRREAHEAGLTAARKHEVTIAARDLEGVAILIDAGHGGDEIGARRNGVHEDDYVYDIMARIKTIAEAETGARVLTTIKDKTAGFKPHNGPFRIDKDEYLLTSPAYHPRKPHAGTAGVNLRWYLVNSYYRSLRAAGTDKQRIVFVSLHADSRHPSVRGAMVYVPGQAYRRRTYGHVGRLYRRKEVEEARYVKFTRSQRVRSEGLSRDLAALVIRSLREAGVPIHKDQPVRDHVIRGRRTYAPAVIRSSLVPQSILLEVVNLNNKKDARLLKDPAFREKVARAFLDALKRLYEGRPAGPPKTVATAKP